MIACLTPKGQKEVPVNAGPVSEGQSDFECVKNENGQVVLKESRGRLADCINGKKQGKEVGRKFVTSKLLLHTHVYDSGSLLSQACFFHQP